MTAAIALADGRPPVAEPEPLNLPDNAIIKSLHTAMGHPLRLDCLRRIGASTAARGLSPRELADITGQPLGNVSYHVRTLADHKVIKLVKKIPRRGAIEHYYAVSPRGEKVLEYLKRLADPT